MKPILFNTEMTRATLEDRKTQTRRVVRPQPPQNARLEFSAKYGVAFDYAASPFPMPDEKISYKPFYLPGDILYVRETWRLYDPHGDFKCDNRKACLQYFADLQCTYRRITPEMEKYLGNRWRPSIHMPKEAARIFLRVTDMRVERLQEITVEGINGEGVDVEPPPICKKGEPNETERAAIERLTAARKEEFISTLARHTYMGWCKYADDLFTKWRSVWDSTVKPGDIDRYGWAANPWIWVYEFERCEKPRTP